MELLSLKNRLERDKLDSKERQDMEERIKKLESELGIE
jgi:hypothetical protein